MNISDFTEISLSGNELPSAFEPVLLSISNVLQWRKPTTFRCWSIPAAGGSTKFGVTTIGYEEVREISAFPSDGYSFASWEIYSGDCNIADPTLSSTQITSYNVEDSLILRCNFDVYPAILITDSNLIQRFTAYTPKNSHSIRIIDAGTYPRDQENLPKTTQTFTAPYSGYFMVKINGGGGWGYSKYLTVKYNDEYIYQSEDIVELKTKQCYLHLTSGTSIEIFAQWSRVDTENLNVDLWIAGIEDGKI